MWFPHPRPRRPFWLNAALAGVFLKWYSFRTAHLRVSQSLTVPSRPAVTIRTPRVEGSRAIETTGPWCAWSWTCGRETEGDQRETVPVGVE